MQTTDSLEKSLMLGKKKKKMGRKDAALFADWGQKEKRASEDEMVGWHHQCNGHEFGQTSGDVEAKRCLSCCRPWGHKESDTTGQLKNKKRTRLLHPFVLFVCIIFLVVLSSSYGRYRFAYGAVPSSLQCDPSGPPSCKAILEFS